MSDNNILDGIRVVDFARYIAGPYCATLLGYLGADVIRVEKPGGAEDRFLAPIGEGMSGIFMQTGCNKRGVCLNLKHDDSGEIVRRLVESADVIVVNMPPAVLKRMGLDYESLRAVKPDIILTTQTCYGHDGPWRNRGGFDGIGQVMSGAAFMSGQPSQPIRTAAPYVDFGTAALGALGTVSALYHRRETGQGQHVQAALLQTALTWFSPALIEQAVVGIDRSPSGNRGQTSAPNDIFSTSDGHVIMMVVGRGFFTRVARLIGADSWIDDPNFSTDEQRGDRRDEICERVAAWCAARPTEKIVELLAEAGVPCGPVLDLDEARTHPQVDAMGIFANLTSPGCSDSPSPRFPLSMSAIEPPQNRPPLIGEHSDEVLQELGFTSEEVEGFHRSGAI